MATKCNFEWTMCETCASAGSSLCPLEHNRTIKRLKQEIEDLKAKLNNIEHRESVRRDAY